MKNIERIALIKRRRERDARELRLLTEKLEIERRRQDRARALLLGRALLEDQPDLVRALVSRMSAREQRLFHIPDAPQQPEGE